MITSLATTNPDEIFTLTRYAYYAYMAEHHTRNAMNAKIDSEANRYDKLADEYLTLCDAFMGKISCDVLVALTRDAMNDAVKADTYHGFLEVHAMHISMGAMAWECIRKDNAGHYS